MKNENNRKLSQPLFEDVDCIHLQVSNLADGIKFYCDHLGLKLLWRTNTSCGLGTKNGSTEIVLSTEDLLTIDLKVTKVEEALELFLESGGKVEEGPFDLDIGKCAVVIDPWGNRYCLLDTTKGTYDTDANGQVTGVS